MGIYNEEWLAFLSNLHLFLCPGQVKFCIGLTIGQCTKHPLSGRPGVCLRLQNRVNRNLEITANPDPPIFLCTTTIGVAQSLLSTGMSSPSCTCYCSCFSTFSLSANGTRHALWNWGVADSWTVTVASMSFKTPSSSWKTSANSSKRPSFTSAFVWCTSGLCHQWNKIKV